MCRRRGEQIKQNFEALARMRRTAPSNASRRIMKNPLMGSARSALTIGRLSCVAIRLILAWLSLKSPTLPPSV